MTGMDERAGMEEFAPIATYLVNQFIHQRYGTKMLMMGEHVLDDGATLRREIVEVLAPLCRRWLEERRVKVTISPEVYPPGPIRFTMFFEDAEEVRP